MTAITAELNQKCGDGNTLREHQRKIRKDYLEGLYKNKPRIRDAFIQLETEEEFRTPAVLSDAVFIAKKLHGFSALELQALCDLYRITLNPLEIDLVFNIKRTLANGNNSDLS